MDRSADTAGPSLHAMKQFATQMRKSAETAIVQSYRQSLEGRGEGPSQANLRVFARLAAYEIRLERRIAQGEMPAVQGPDDGQPELDALRPQLPAPILVERAAEAPPTSLPVTTARRALPLAALASTCLLVVCAAVTAWMVGSTSADAARRPDTVSRSVPQTVPPAPSVRDAARSQAESQALAPAISEGRSVRKSSSVSANADGASRARVVRPATLVAACGGLNFLSRAVCMNNACAQPAMTHARVCTDAVRQRRIDEARRNPTLLG